MKGNSRKLISALRWITYQQQQKKTTTNKLFEHYNMCHKVELLYEQSQQVNSVQNTSLMSL